MSGPTVNVELPDGTPGTVPASQVAALPEGTRRMSDEEVGAAKQQIALDQKYEFREGNMARSVLGGVGAATAGAARGATFGLSDVAGSAFGLRGELNELRGAFPLASGVGEAAGMIGMGIATGGIGAEAGAAGLAGRVALGTARGAAEMGLYQAGRTAGDMALANEDFDAEKVVAAFGHGALLGGGIGALTTLGGAAIGRAFHGGGAPPALPAAGAIERQAARGSLREVIGEQAAGKSDDFFANALGATKGQVKKINQKVEGGFGRVAADTKAALREELGVASLPADRKVLLEGVESQLEKRNATRLEMLEKLDASKSGVAPSFSGVANRIDADFVSPNLVQRTMQTAEGTVVQMVPKLGKEAEVAAAQDLMKRFEVGFGDQGPNFKGFAEAITDLGKEAKFEAATAPIAAKVKQQVYGMMSRELQEAGDKAAATLGESFSAGYKANQGVLQSLIKAKGLLETGVAGYASNNAMGLTSRIAGIAGAGVGSMIGGPVGGLAGGLVSGGITKMVQDRGAMLASDLLERAAATMGVRRFAARTEADIARGVRSLTGGKVATAPGELAPPSRAASKRDFEKTVKSVVSANANPVATIDRVSNQIAAMNAPPKVANAVAMTAMRGASFLMARLPSGRDEYSLQPQFQSPTARISDGEKAKFMRYVDAVDRPAAVLEKAKKGTLTAEHVEALKEVYPNLYESIRQQVAESLLNTREKLSYARRIQLGILLDLPTDHTLSPEFLAAIQGTFSSAEKAGAESPPPTLARPLNVASDLQTDTQSASERL